jgi:hypothetical protein
MGEKKIQPCQVRYPTHRDRTAMVCSEGWMVPFRNLWPINPINSWCMVDCHFIPLQTAGASYVTSP